MVAVALLFGITATVSKRAMLQSSPATIPFIYNTSIALSMAPLVIYRLRTRRSVVQADANISRIIMVFLALGLLSALASIFYFKSISLVNVAYAISIKRLSLLMSVGYGWIFFKERDIHIRLLSTLCMFFGAVLVIMS